MTQTRRPIRKKVQAMVLYISIAALAITSIVGIISMVRIQDDSESALIRQMERNLYNITASKAELAESELGKYTGYAGDFARFITSLYVSSGDYSPVEVLRSNAINAGKFTMQLDIAGEAVKHDAIAGETALLGNLEKIWQSVIPEQEDVITSVYAGTESGFIIAYDKNSENVEEGEYYDFLQTSWYKEAKSAGRVIFTDVYDDSFGRGLTITCAAPFNDAEGKFAGVVAMDILISDLYREIVSLELGLDSYAFLVDGEGKIISPSDIGTGKAQSIHDEKDISPFVASEILAGKTGVSLANGLIYYAYTPIKSTGWKFCVRIPESVILAPVRDVNRNVILTMLMFAAAFVVILGLVAVVARKFSARLTSPIIALDHDVKEISSGNLDYRAEIRSNDEIGDLAQSFNDMAASLKDYIKNLAAVTAEKERIGAELNVATQIQADMLPRIFPPFPDRTEFDLYASMTPAKEVGGDFYDFFLIDDDHLALVIADVSGKGVPAALFMVIAKTLIKNRAMMKTPESTLQASLTQGGEQEVAPDKGRFRGVSSPNEILADVNSQLCEGNDADLFVTVWLGILEISTGHVTCSNAGHEYPAIRKANGNYELFKTKQSPAVATMDGIRFRQSEFTLGPGDSLYIYTDGVPEATDIHETLYGTDRMLDVLNTTGGKSPSEVVDEMKRSVFEFTGEAPQFDDVTMLYLKFIGGGKSDMHELVVDADTEKLDEVLDFIDGYLEEWGFGMKTQTQINIAAEEIFVNIAHYAYENHDGKARITVSRKGDDAEITFTDSGVPYDPLAKPDPDVTLSAEERQIGGLGIYIVKKSMDSVSYEHRDGQNILTFSKRIG
ncbi:MAG: SpoIIE family protein phosphatase [Synergistaceae bacterium]|nr:SpoIIE family protein phosphatase [Synergistaceae bacterium]